MAPRSLIFDPIPKETVYQKTHFLRGATTTAAAEEFPVPARPHPITQGYHIPFGSSPSLRLHVGAVSNEEECDWFYGRNTDSNEFGWFPQQVLMASKLSQEPTLVGGPDVSLLTDCMGELSSDPVAARPEQVSWGNY